MNAMKSVQAVPVTVRSMVSTGIFLDFASARAGPSPSEFSGATIRALAPCAIMSWICEFCALTSALALRSMSLTPSRLASFSMLLVSVARNGLLVDSDWEKPTTVLPSVMFSLATPPAYLSDVHAGPEALSVGVATCWAAAVLSAALLDGELAESLPELVQAAADRHRPAVTIAAATALARGRDFMRRSHPRGQ